MNDFKFCTLTQIIPFSINHLLAHSEVVSTIVNTNGFICTQLNGFKYCYLTLIIQSIRDLFTQLNSFKFRKWLHISIWPTNGT